MSHDQETFNSDLKELIKLSLTNDDQKLKSLVAILEKHKLVKADGQSKEKFDKIHNQLIDMLFSHPSNRLPVFDLSEYKQFDILMKRIRQDLESLTIRCCIASERLDKTERELVDVKAELSGVKEEVEDVRDLVYEGQYNRLCFGVSTPLKETLARCFRAQRTRIDPLNQRVRDEARGMTNERMDGYDQRLIVLLRSSPLVSI